MQLKTSLFSVGEFTSSSKALMGDSPADDESHLVMQLRPDLPP